jgi:hypothetical protein
MHRHPVINHAGSIIPTLASGHTGPDSAIAPTKRGRVRCRGHCRTPAFRDVDRPRAMAPQPGSPGNRPHPGARRSTHEALAPREFRSRRRSRSTPLAPDPKGVRGLRKAVRQAGATGPWAATSGKRHRSTSVEGLCVNAHRIPSRFSLLPTPLARALDEFGDHSATLWMRPFGNGQPGCRGTGTSQESSEK